jgi:hypothetical protein
MHYQKWIGMYAKHSCLPKLEVWNVKNSCSLNLEWECSTEFWVEFSKPEGERIDNMWQHRTFLHRTFNFLFNFLFNSIFIFNFICETLNYYLKDTTLAERVNRNGKLTPIRK